VNENNFPFTLFPAESERERSREKERERESEREREREGAIDVNFFIVIFS
jgi:hypothetical protein